MEIQQEQLADQLHLFSCSEHCFKFHILYQQGFLFKIQNNFTNTYGHF